jgi:16S rRNA (cytosine1402-N4)-methyltransferase
VEKKHIPVLLDEVIDLLNLKRGDDAIDATLGGGGHSSAILEATAPDGRLLGIERDGRTLEEARKRLEPFGTRAMLVHGNFRDIGRLARAYAFPQVSAIVFDLGYSSFQIDDAGRGFSFRFDGPLDMRFDPTQELTAAHIVNGWSQDDLAALLRDFGEERSAGRIAKAIVLARKRGPIVSTKALAEIVSGAVRKRGRIHPATQTFQALRIAVNDELGSIEKALPEAAELLKPGGRLAVISFHSLEDRIVKRFFLDSGALKPLAKRPIVPTEDEIERNPRSRSAKLRIAERR